MTENTDALVEEIMRAIREAIDEASGLFAIKEGPESVPLFVATAILPIIERARIAGVKAGIEAAQNIYAVSKYRGDVGERLNALDPATIAGRASTD
jgi:hypothetical protein